jgi:glycosyltransferase involved in cell wall biosynthesis
MSAVRVSVIVPVFNADKTLPACLMALRAQLGPRDELLVVDDGSTDRSAELARAVAAGDARVRMLAGEPHAGVAAARNRGARAARGELLLFTDADATLAPGALERACRTLAVEERADAVVGIYAAECGPENVASRFKNLWIRDSYLRAKQPIQWLFGCIFCLPRALYEELGGFTESFSRGRGGGDIELGMRLAERGGTILLDRGLEVVHLRRYSARSLLANDLRRCAGYTALGLERLGLRRLARRRGFANIGADYLAGVVLVGLALGSSLGSLLHPDLLYLAGAALLGYSALCLRFYRYLARHGGWRFAWAGAALLLGSHAVCLLGIPLGCARALRRLYPGALHGRRGATDRAEAE